MFYLSDLLLSSAQNLLNVSRIEWLFLLKGTQHDANVRQGIAEVPLQQTIARDVTWNIVCWAGHMVIYVQKR